MRPARVGSAPEAAVEIPPQNGRLRIGHFHTVWQPSGAGLVAAVVSFSSLGSPLAPNTQPHLIRRRTPRQFRAWAHQTWAAATAAA